MFVISKLFNYLYRLYCVLTFEYGVTSKTKTEIPSTYQPPTSTYVPPPKSIVPSNNHLNETISIKLTAPPTVFAPSSPILPPPNPVYAQPKSPVQLPPSFN